MSISPARTAAFDILLRVEQQNAYASELLHSSRYNTLSSADHGLATELVMGVLRWRSWLDRQINSFSSQKLERLDLEVLTALRIAAYQVLSLDRIPQRAAVHESVELVKRARKRSAAPFVNALLRKLCAACGHARESRDNIQAAPGAELCPEPAAPSVPPRQVSEINLENLADRYAHPSWLVRRWHEKYGMESAQLILHHNQSIPAVSLVRPVPRIQSALQRCGIVLASGNLLTKAARVTSGDVTASKEFREGKVLIQDEASQLIAFLVGKGRRILDCCAAPGGKTRILAARNPQAKIVAAELHPHRARRLQALLLASNVEVVNTDARELRADQSFDRILVDVPCSGTGTLARNPDIKWRLRPEDLHPLQERQLALLRSAMSHLAPDGILVYSTCSLEGEENEAVIEKALVDQARFRVIDCRSELQRLRMEGELAWQDIPSLVHGPYLRTIPGVHPCDGFFAAIIQRL